MQNLERALNAKGISTRAVATLIGTSEKTAYNKLKGITELTVREALKINKDLLPEYRFGYLFAEDDKQSA